MSSKHPNYILRVEFVDGRHKQFPYQTEKGAMNSYRKYADLDQVASVDIYERRSTAYSQAKLDLDRLPF